MTKTRRIVSIAMVCLILVSTIFATILPAAAATTSSGTSTRTITVNTKANWWKPGSESITISQAKGVCTKKSYNIFTGKWSAKSSNQYGEWDIRVEATDGSHSYTETLTGSSIKLKLKANKTYKITITWDSQAATLKEVSKGNYTTYPTWRVSKTNKVSSYY